MRTAHPLFGARFFFSALLLFAIVFASLPSIGLSRGPSVLFVPDADGTLPRKIEASRVAIQTRSTPVLNRFTFNGNVMGDLVDDWFVMFCTGWDEECQELLPSYEGLGEYWENKKNNGLFSSSVRFARVDCTIEKPLCNSVEIPGYPSIVHWRRGGIISAWFGGGPKYDGGASELSIWVKRQLESSTASDSTATSAVNDVSSFDWQRLAVRPLGLVLILIIVARQAWTFFVSANQRPAPRPKHEPVHRDKIEQPCSGRRVPGARHRHHAATNAPTALPGYLPQEWIRERPDICL